MNSHRIPTDIVREVRSRKRWHALWPLLSLILLAIFAPWIAQDQPLYVRGASLRAWERARERLWNAVVAADEHAYAHALSTTAELVHHAPWIDRLVEVDRTSQDEGARWQARRSQLTARFPELLADQVCAAMERDRDVLDAALAPALRRLPAKSELLAFAANLERAAEIFSSAAWGADLAKVAAQARAAAERGERRLAEHLSEDWRALASALDRWRGATESERRKLFAVSTAAPPELIHREAWPILQRATFFELSLWAVALGAILGWLGARFLPRVLSAAQQKYLLCAAPVFLLALAAVIYRATRVPDAWIDYRAEIAAGQFTVDSAWYAPLCFGPEQARGEPAELMPLASRVAWEQRGGVIEAHDPAPAPGNWLRHPLGTDLLGRDVAARLVHGTRLSLWIGLLGASAAAALGISLGALAGFAGGLLDRVVRRLIEVLSCFPTLLFALALAAVRGPAEDLSTAILGIVMVLVIARWTFLARLARSEVLRVREEPFVDAARAFGCPPLALLWRHILPHALPTLAIALTMEFAAAMVFESALSFLGLGIREPSATWGGILHGALLAPSAWWLSLFPGLALLCAVVSAHRLGSLFETDATAMPLRRSVRA